MVTDVGGNTAGKERVTAPYQFTVQEAPITKLMIPIIGGALVFVTEGLLILFI